jgi:hypothetical protein
MNSFGRIRSKIEILMEQLINKKINYQPLIRLYQNTNTVKKQYYPIIALIVGIRKIGESMAETLGSLCDKLTIVKLKQFHTGDLQRLESLTHQEKRLCEEIDSFIRDAAKGEIPQERLVFSSNKIYKKNGNEINEISGTISTIFAELAKVNCDLWHEQEKVYEFEKVPVDKKDTVIKRLALLNLQRTQCIDEMDKMLQLMIINKD